jgi:hypothetical protein
MNKEEMLAIAKEEIISIILSNVEWGDFNYETSGKVEYTQEEKYIINQMINIIGCRLIDRHLDNISISDGTNGRLETMRR